MVRDILARTRSGRAVVRKKGETFILLRWNGKSQSIVKSRCFDFTNGPFLGELDIRRIYGAHIEEPSGLIQSYCACVPCWWYA
jgi:hypothetical protein